MMVTRILESRNHNYVVYVNDRAVDDDPVLLKQKGQKFARLKKQQDYLRTYGRFVTVVLFNNDDDCIMTKNTNDYDECLSLFEELVTCPNKPDFDNLGFK